MKTPTKPNPAARWIILAMLLGTGVVGCGTLVSLPDPPTPDVKTVVPGPQTPPPVAATPVRLATPKPKRSATPTPDPSWDPEDDGWIYLYPDYRKRR